MVARFTKNVDEPQKKLCQVAGALAMERILPVSEEDKVGGRKGGECTYGVF